MGSLAIKKAESLDHIKRIKTVCLWISLVPVVDGEGLSVKLPTSILNKLGYGIEFVGTGEYNGCCLSPNLMQWQQVVQNWS